MLLFRNVTLALNRIIAIEMTRKFFNHIFLVSLFIASSCKPKLEAVETNNFPINETVEADSNTNSWLNYYKDSLEKSMNVLIAKTSVSLESSRSKGIMDPTVQEKGNLARICSDYVLQNARNWSRNNDFPLPMFTVLNHNGFRNSISAGNITIGNVFEVMPFDNEIVLVQLSGSTTDSLFRYISSIGGSAVSGLSLTLDVNNSQYTNALVGVNKFNSRQSYWMCTSDFLLEGGDGYTMFANAKQIIKTGILVRDALLEGFEREYERSKQINPQVQPRIHYAN